MITVGDYCGFSGNWKGIDGMMEAGRVLDRKIAEVVFGRDPMTARFGLRADGDKEYSWGYPLGHDIAPYYSTDIAAAWTIMEVMTESRHGIGSTLRDGIPVATRFYHLIKASSLLCSTASEAAAGICNLALQALGIEV